MFSFPDHPCPSWKGCCSAPSSLLGAHLLCRRAGEPDFALDNVGLEGHPVKFRFRTTENC